MRAALEGNLMQLSLSRAVLALCVSSLVLIGAALARADVPDGLTILNADSQWRYHVTLRRPIVPAGDGRSAPTVLEVRVSYRSYPGLEQLETPLPPAAWVEPDFDDSSWPCGPARGHGSVEAAVFRPAVGHSTGLLCLRGRFAVSDPSAVRSLALTMKYRGGAVVRLNGRQVARGHLPDGELSPGTPGQAYPPEAFALSRGQPTPAEASIRTRSLGPIELPAAALRKGVNVLTIELHRSDYGPGALSWFRGGDNRGEWTPVGLESIELKAGSCNSRNVSSMTIFIEWIVIPIEIITTCGIEWKTYTICKIPTTIIINKSIVIVINSIRFFAITSLTRILPDFVFEVGMVIINSRINDTK